MDIGIDIGLLLKLFEDIRNSFGLSDDKLKEKTHMIPTIAPFVNQILKFATKEGVHLLLKNFASREVVKHSAKYIPFVGSIIASSIGYGITLSAGMSYLEDCYKIANAILQSELKK